MRPEPTWEVLEAEYEFIWPCHHCGSKLDPKFDLLLSNVRKAELRQLQSGMQ